MTVKKDSAAGPGDRMDRIDRGRVTTPPNGQYVIFLGAEMRVNSFSLLENMKYFGEILVLFHYYEYAIKFLYS